ncbi:MAG: hypoxanthine phosphoribosyltransferase [Actinobacteria bacterium]|nr:hypoxanthine phosphoribosyltransferase [Actinomycetota bacterium]MCB9411362.1 hypoxanthine phosphoribosyltransferase [Actinomycetota bacterium]
MDPADVNSDIIEVLLTPEQIETRIAELAAEIDSDYRGQDLLLVGVLKGAIMVMADLSRALRTSASIEWMAISSYGSRTSSSGVLRILKDLDQDVAGRHVLVVEDVLDSGLTLDWLRRTLKARGASSLKVMTLLRKPEAVHNGIEVDYLGFDIPDEFVVGYGLDYAERYRNLRCVGVLNPAVFNGR